MTTQELDSAAGVRVTGPLAIEGTEPTPCNPAAHDREIDRIGRYRVESLLGRGGMGVVYLAWDPRVRRRVAVKTFSAPDGLTLRDEQARVIQERFQREAQAAGSVPHPGIVTVYDVDRDPERGLPFIAMEYVPGSSLRQVLDAEGPLEPERAFRIVRGIAEVLETAHRSGLVHRDIKSANVLLRDSDSAVKVSDWGIARLPDEYDHVRTSDLTQPGTTLGSPGYMAPEQLAGRPADPRSDLYSLAVILYEALCGEPPFAGGDVLSLAYSILNDTPVRITRRVPGLPAALDAFFERALAKNPGSRFPDAAAFREALDHAVSPPAVEQETPVECAAPTRRRLAVASAAVLLLVAMAAWVLSGPGEPLPPAPSSATTVAKASGPDRETPSPTASRDPGVARTGYLELDARSKVKAGTLTVLLDGDPVLSRRLASDRSGVRRLLGRLFGGFEQRFEVQLEVPPGRHTLVARLVTERGNGPYENTVVIDLEPEQRRVVQLVAGRSFGKRVSLEAL